MLRRIMLCLSLFTFVPSLMNTAWAAENRGKFGAKQECELRAAKFAEEELGRENRESQGAFGISKKRQVR